MANLYTNENFPLPAARELRQLGHDVITVQESGLGGQSITDEQVLSFAVERGRSVVTMNRRHFVRLHQNRPEHAGIIVCTADNDFGRLATRIDGAIRRHDRLTGRLVRVDRSS